MSDSGPAVVWCIEYGCPLRRGKAVVDPWHSYWDTSDVRWFSHRLSEPSTGGYGLFGDIFVTSCCLKRGSPFPRDRDKHQPIWQHNYPSNGYPVREKFPLGVEQMFAMC